MKQHGRDRAWPFAVGSGSTITLFTLILGVAITFWFRFVNLLAGIFLFIATSLWLLILYFFRDPNRLVVNEPGLVIGPADGKVMAIVHEAEARYLQSEAIRVSIFLSITDVHLQRIPLGGEVILIEHQPGQFVEAFKPEASDVNEYIAMVLETEYGRVLIKQIAGILARRCVNYLQPGHKVTTGQRFGLIKFGSRVDLFLPTDAKLLVTVGDQVYGGLTPIAYLQPVTFRD